MTVELRPHQRKAVEELSNGKVLVGGVGTGKTLTSLVYYYEKVLGGVLGDLSTIRRNIPLYVFTTARKRDELDWQHDAAKMGLYDLITVDSYNNIGKYTDIHDTFIILDEQRMVGSGAWTKAFLHMAKSNQWIMLSATPGDVWEDYIPLFLANGFYKNRTQFKREHIVYSAFTKYPKVERYLGVNRLVKLRDSLLVQMPYERHTKRHIREILVDYDKELFEKVVKKRWHVYENRPLKDVSELFAVMRKVVNSHTSRIDVVNQLLTTHPRLIVFYNFDYELEILRAEFAKTKGDTSTLDIVTSTSSSSSRISTLIETQLPSSKNAPPLKGLDTKASESTRSFVVAEWNGHKHEPVPVGDRWVYLVQYQAGAEAWNCTTTDTICFYSLTYSWRNLEQAQGRIDRLNTPFSDLNYYVLASKSQIDLAILKALKAKKSFNEKSFLKSF